MIVDTNTTRPYRVLIAEDDPEHQHLLQRVLKRSCEELNTVVVDKGEDFIDQLQVGTYDCVIMDYNLPDFRADQLLQEAAPFLGDTPVVIISSSRDQEVIFLCMREGGVDFVPKADALRGEVLWKRVHAAIESYRQKISQQNAVKRAQEQMVSQIDELRDSYQDLEKHQANVQRMSQDLVELNMTLAHQARTDPLTNLLNRAAIEECLELENQTAFNHGRAYSLILIDIDFFKRYNDTYGHSAGDQCLTAVSGAIKKASRNTDYVGRYGGEELIVLCPNTPLDQAEALAERIRIAVVDLCVVHGQNDASPYVTISLGFAAGPAATWQNVLDDADAALYRSKDAGRNLSLSFVDS